MATKTIQLSQGYSVKIDAADEPLVSQYSWHVVRLNGRLYAKGYAGEQGYIFLHRFLMAAAPNAKVMFLNGDTLDCRRDNLWVPKGWERRAATNYRRLLLAEGETPAEAERQYIATAKDLRDNPTLPRAPKKAHGVIYQPITKRWEVYVPLVPGHREYVGRFATLEEAKQRYVEKYTDRLHGRRPKDVPMYKGPGGPVPNPLV